MHSFKRILVPTDLSDFEDLAVRFALLFNERLGTRITMLHAQKLSWLGADHPVGYYFEHAIEAKQLLQARLREYAKRTSPESAHVKTMFADDDPRHAILKTADEICADLIVMATHGRHGLRRALIGSVAETVLRDARCPVMTVTPRLFAEDEQPAIRTILCPIDSSDVARESFEEASAIATAFDAELIVMHVDHGLKGNAADRLLAVADDVHADLVVIGTMAERITRFARHAVLTVARKSTSLRRDRDLHHSVVTFAE